MNRTLVTFSGWLLFWGLLLPNNITNSLILSLLFIFVLAGISVYCLLEYNKVKVNTKYKLGDFKKDKVRLENGLKEQISEFVDFYGVRVEDIELVYRKHLSRCDSLFLISFNIKDAK